MNDKVVSIREGFMPSQAIQEPVASVIHFLESLLDRARNGDLVAVAAVYQHRDGAISDYNVGGVSCALVGGLECRRARMVKELLDLEDLPPRIPQPPEEPA